MLRQQITHLKNIIVFKIVICILCGAFIAWRIPIGKEELQNSIENLHIANAELADIEKKVMFTKESKDIIDATYHTYSEALKVPFNVSCIVRENVEAKLTSLGQDFRLQDNPVMTISPMPLIAKFNESRVVQILSNELTLSFSAQGFRHALAFTKEAYKLLPVYSLMTTIHIEEKDVITPSTIRQLAINIEPQLIDGELKIQTREIKASED